MRADLNKLLCEHERRRSKDSHKQYRRKRQFNPFAGPEAENLAAREGIAFRYGYNAKEFSENLNPLKGQIRKAVNRPWDKFYSDLCQVFDKRSVINQHILQHVDDFIATKDIHVGDDGKLYVLRRFMSTLELLSKSGFEFYVDPRDGIIKKNRHYRRVRYAPIARVAKTTHVIDADNVLHRIGDIWFQFKVADLPKGKWDFIKPDGVDTFDVFGKARRWEQLNERERRARGIQRWSGRVVVDAFTHQTLPQLPKYGRSAERYHYAKRSASHKLLKQCGLAE